MENKQLLDEAIEELLKENDGVNPNSPIPIEEQLEKKRAEYREYLELKPFKLRVEKAFEVIQDEMPERLGEDKYEVLVSELVGAGEILTEHPEMQGKKLGVSDETFTLLFTFAENFLKKNEFEKAAALFTLLTVLDSTWYRHWFFLGIVMQEIKDYKEAIKAYKKANEISEESPLPHFFLAECFADLDDLQNASAHFEQAKEIVATLPSHPDFERLINELGARIK